MAPATIAQAIHGRKASRNALEPLILRGINARYEAAAIPLESAPFFFCKVTLVVPLDVRCPLSRCDAKIIRMRILLLALNLEA